MVSRETLRYILEVSGLLFLLVACALHSWAWDAAGIGLLVLGQAIVPPAGLAGAFSSVLLFLSAPVEEPSRARKPWDLADSAYFRQCQDNYVGQLTFDFPQRSEDTPFNPAPVAYTRCDYAVTPCGRPTHVRAWGDLH